MRRRDFFKVITGFVAGIFATSTKAEEKPQLTVAMIKKARDELVAAQKVSQDIYGDPDILCKRSGTRYLCRPKSGPPGPTDIDTMTMGGYSNYIYICGVSDLNDDI